MKALEKIYKFNKEAGLLDLPYSDFREAEYTIEESLEDLDTSYLAKKLHRLEDTSPKELSRTIVTGMCYLPEGGVTPVKRFDKALDKLVFTYGDLLKQGVTFDQIDRGLNVVMDRNLTKLSVGKDSEGKQMKPTDFVGPEEELQKILDERNGSL